MLFVATLSAVSATIAAAAAAAAQPVPRAPAMTVAVRADVPVAQISPYMVGAGIEDVNHELVGGISTQLIWGESFEEPSGNTTRGVSALGTNGKPTWLPTAGSGPACEFETVQKVAPQTGVQSQFVAGAGCGLRNRGLDFGGHFYAGGKPYAGYFFARAETAAVVKVSLTDWQRKATLASATVSLRPGASWAQHNFSLTPAKSTSCTSVPVGSDEYKTCTKNAEDLCPVCTGEFVLEIVSGGELYYETLPSCCASTVFKPKAVPFLAGRLSSATLLDQVYLEPSWQKYNGDQPTRADVVEQVSAFPCGPTAKGTVYLCCSLPFVVVPLLVDVVEQIKGVMGWGVLRNGGSQCNSDGYRWKRFRGPAVRVPVNNNLSLSLSLSLALCVSVCMLARSCRILVQWRSRATVPPSAFLAGLLPG
eukprot:SAG22_NODE_56_length_23716_cov_11.146759_1_plen_420_part_00